jgi:hypothetical protein
MSKFENLDASKTTFENFKNIAQGHIKNQYFSPHPSSLDHLIFTKITNATTQLFALQIQKIILPQL